MGDVLLNVGVNYNFLWEDSVLFSFLSSHYMVSDLKISLVDRGIVYCKKYNVFGSFKGSGVLNVYESRGELEEVLYSLNFEDIVKIETIK